MGPATKMTRGSRPCSFNHECCCARHARPWSGGPSCPIRTSTKESQLRAIAPKTKMARVMRAIFVSDPVKSEFGCGEAQPPIPTFGSSCDLTEPPASRTRWPSSKLLISLIAIGVSVTLCSRSFHQFVATFLRPRPVGAGWHLQPGIPMEHKIKLSTSTGKKKHIS